MINQNKKSLTIIFLVVFFDLIGFGMIIPLSPYLAREYGASALEVGLLLSIYSLMQIIFAPVWGRWSDRAGRRPILLISLLGTGLCHLAFAYSSSLTALFISRGLAGVFGANISTAMAYAADLTSTKDRSKAMGLVGAAFGLGFVFGPFFGGILGDIGTRLGDSPPYGHSFSALVAGVICVANAVFAAFVLKESLSSSTQDKAEKTSKLQLMKDVLFRPVTGSLIAVNFLASFSMSQMEASLFLLVRDRFEMDLASASFGFAYLGLVIAITQGYFVRRLIPLWGERKLIIVGTTASGLAMAIMGFSPTLMFLAVAVTCMAFGFGVRMPALNGAISLSTGEHEQGSIMGANHSLLALGRILGPPLGGWLYGSFGAETNFLVAGFFGLSGLIIVQKIYLKIPQGQKMGERRESDVSVGGLAPEAMPSSTPAFSKNPAVSLKPASQGSQSADRSSRMNQPGPIVLGEKPKTPLSQPPDIEKVQSSDRVTAINASQFRSLFSKSIQFLFFDLRALDAVPQYSRAIKVSSEQVLLELEKRTQDKRAPILFLCEDGSLSRQMALQVAEKGFINVVVLEGGAKSLDRTGHL